MSETLDPVTRHHIHNAAEALKEEFSGIFSVETIERYIAESVDALGNSRITVFVPVLAHRLPASGSWRWPRRRISCPPISPRSCSSASTTPAGRRWPPAC